MLAAKVERYNRNGKILELARMKKASDKERHKRLHQFLSDIGVKALRQHLGELIGIAKLSNDRTEYERNVAKIFGEQTEMLAARDLPPFRPNATAAGSFPSSGPGPSLRLSKCLRSAWQASLFP